MSFKLLCMALIALGFGLAVAFGGLTPAELLVAPVLSAINDSWLWFIFFNVVAAAGIFVQLQANRGYEVEE